MSELVAIVLFVIALALIATERIDRTKVALAGGGLAVILGLLSQEEAIEAIDWGVVGLLAGMMILVWGAERSGIFRYLAIRVGQWSQGRPARLIFGLTGATAVASAFLDNVTTVLLVVPITLAIADALDVPAVPLVVAEVIASNLGGAATLIGDPPNIIIAGESGLSFLDFIVNVGPPAALSYLVVTVALLAIYRERLRAHPDRVAELGLLDATAGLGARRDVMNILVCLSLTIIGFFIHSALGLEPPTVALAGAVLYLLIAKVEIDEPLVAIEWPTLFFFAGLFVLVGGLEVSGVLDNVAERLQEATSGSDLGEVMILAWGSAFASGVVDNIPFTAAMSPVVSRIATAENDSAWWALSIGACYGGNFTLIAASANLVAAGALRRAGQAISFMQFLKIGIPMTLLSMVVATGWLLLTEV
jgi:Na+/H+ antiporter NhaD/arsenite permease-like protein